MFRARIKVEGKNYQEMSDFQRRLDTIKLVLKQETWSETQQRLYQEMKNSTLFYTETKEGIFYITGRMLPSIMVDIPDIDDAAYNKQARYSVPLLLGKSLIARAIMRESHDKYGHLKLPAAVQAQI